MLLVLFRLEALQRTDLFKFTFRMGRPFEKEKASQDLLSTLRQQHQRSLCRVDISCTQLTEECIKELLSANRVSQARHCDSLDVNCCIMSYTPPHIPDTAAVVVASNDVGELLPDQSTPFLPRQRLSLAADRYGSFGPSSVE
jgi:hypothetical protein